MKTIETKLYSYAELSPSAQDRVIELHARRVQNSDDNFTLSECISSLKAVAKYLGGFTGVCFDEDVCEAILSALLDGETMSKAFDRAADKIMEICEKDIEYQSSKEGILEYLDQDEEIYTEEGNEF